MLEQLLDTFIFLVGWAIHAPGDGYGHVRVKGLECLDLGDDAFRGFRIWYPHVEFRFTLRWHDVNPRAAVDEPDVARDVRLIVSERLETENLLRDFLDGAATVLVSKP